jgi:hypothetical protein
MTATTTSSQPQAGRQLTRPFELTCFALCVAHVVYFPVAYLQGIWLFDPSGQAIATDFVNVWAAGRQALEGQVVAVYDVALHKAAEVAALGHGFDGQYPWVYPPAFLLVAMLLALLPYAAAYVAWVALTFPLYVLTIRAIVGRRDGILIACAYPGLLANAVVGQNGFATAALLGGALVLMERSPVAAGCLVGLLSFKPHLGVLLPIALLAGGHWRVFFSASVVVALLTAAAWAAFGLETSMAFFHSVQVASRSTLELGNAEWGKLQSIYGLVRAAGGPSGLAWTMQSVLAGVVAVSIFALWRSKAPFELKAAALATGTLLVTPYIFLYDLVVLAVAMAFLLRASAKAGPVPGEMPGLAVACLLILIFPVFKAPVGFGATLVVALLIARRLSLAPSQAADPALRHAHG